MKTIIIWDDTQGDIKFFTVKGDKSHLNGTYLGVKNVYPKGSPQALRFDADQQEVTDLLQEDDEGYRKMDLDFPHEELATDIGVAKDVKVIVCGILS